MSEVRKTKRVGDRQSPNSSKIVSQNCPPLGMRDTGKKRQQKKSYESLGWEDLLMPTPSLRQALIGTSEYGNRSFTILSKIITRMKV